MKGNACKSSISQEGGKLKGNRLNEEENNSRLGAWSLGGLEIRGSTTVVPSSQSDNHSRKKAPLTTTLPPIPTA